MRFRILHVVAAVCIGACLLAALPQSAHADAVTVDDMTMGDPVDSNSWYAGVWYGGDSDADHGQLQMTSRYRTGFKNNDAV